MKDRTTDRYPTLYSVTGNIVDINTLLVPRSEVPALPAPAAGEPEVPTECMNLVDDHGAQRWSTGAYEQLGDDTLAAEADAKAVAARRLVEAAISAYGDARAEHARRVAMEEAALIVDAEEDNAQEERYHPGLVGALAACATAIRAAAPQQGETR